MKRVQFQEIQCLVIISLKNNNFKFDKSTVDISLANVVVGDGDIIEGRAKARKMKWMNVTIVVSSIERP